MCLATVAPAQVALPVNIDFESAEGYSTGTLHLQHGWQVSAGSADVTSAVVFSGTRAIALNSGATAAQVSQAFAQLSGQPVVFADFWAQPVADSSTTLASTFDVEGSRFAFVQSSGHGVVYVMDGNGSGGGTWRATPTSITLDTSNRAAAWVRFSLRLDFTTKHWDLYVNGAMVAYDLGFRNNASTYFSNLTLTGHTAATGYFDYFYAGADNPLFTDADKDGMDDSWETAHGLNPATNDRNADPDDDGLSNIAEFMRGTHPNNADSDGDGIPDGIEVALGTNPAVADAATTPARISGLTVHLKADAGVTVDGSNGVATWADQSGNANHATQGNSGRRPLLVASSLNGLPILRFDGGSSAMDLATVLTSASAGELFVVLKAAATTSGQDGRLFASLGGSGMIIYPTSSGHISDSFGTNQSHDLATPANLTQFHVYNVSASATQWNARLDGAFLYANTVNTVGFGSTGWSPVIGADRTGAYYSLGSFFGGDVAEIIIYNRTLSLDERSAIGAYLKQKYNLGITAPSVPANIRAISVSPSRVSLSWTASAAGQVFIVERLNGSVWQEVAKIAEQTSFTDTGLSAATSYSYRIKARNFAGESSPSSTSSVTTSSSATDLPLTGISLWLRPENLVLTTSGIARWGDAGSGGMDATQEAFGNRPATVAGVINGQPLARFNGSSSYFNLSNFMSGASAGEMFVVAKAAVAAPGSDARLFASIGSSGPTSYPAGNGQIGDGFGASTMYSFGVGTADLTQPQLYSVSAASNAWTASLNGNVLYNTSSNTVNFSGGSGPLIGSDRTGAWNSLANWYGGDLAEVLVYNHTLSSTERQAVGSYFKNKYNLPIATPSAPSNFAVIALSTTRIALSWTGSGSNETYAVERSANGGAWQSIATLSGTTSYTDDSLTAGTLYSYRVKATNYASASGYTAVTSATTFASGDIIGELPATGMKLWLKPEDLAQAASGLDQWTDRSGGAHHATQTSAGNRPQVIPGAINGQPVARFNGTNSYLNLPNFLSGTTAGELVVVMRAATLSPPADARLFTYLGSTPATVYPTGSGQISDGFGSTTGHTFSPGAVTLTTAHVYEASTSATGWNAFLNGANVCTTTSNTVTFADTSFTPLIGADRSGSYYSLANWFGGDVAEIIIYDHALSYTERVAVARYVTQKYAIAVWPLSLAVSDPTGDADGDGITNADEVNLYGTNPLLADSDGDGMPDGWEILHGLNPKVNDAAGDLDGDGMSNLQEYLYKRNPAKGVVPDNGTQVQLNLYTPLFP